MARDIILLAARRKVGAPEHKAALMALAAFATPEGRVLASDVTAAWGASEMSRAAFAAALRALKAAGILVVERAKNLVGDREIVEIDINVSALERASSTDIQIEDGNPTAAAWTEGKAYLRERGLPDWKAGQIIGRLLKTARNDAGAVVQAVRSARQIMPADPVSWLMAAVKPQGENHDQSLVAASDRRADRLASGFDPSAFAGAYR